MKVKLKQRTPMSTCAFELNGNTTAAAASHSHSHDGHHSHGGSAADHGHTHEIMEHVRLSY